MLLPPRDSSGRALQMALPATTRDGLWTSDGEEEGEEMQGPQEAQLILLGVLLNAACALSFPTPQAWGTSAWAHPQPQGDGFWAPLPLRHTYALHVTSFPLHVCLNSRVGLAPSQILAFPKARTYFPGPQKRKQLRLLPTTQPGH